MESVLILMATLAVFYVGACVVLNEEKGQDSRIGLLRMRRPAPEGNGAGPVAGPRAGTRPAPHGRTGVAAKARAARLRR